MNIPSWSYERLLNFAPDSSTLEQARKLFFSKKWLYLEGNGDWLWGEYKTAYGHLFKVAVRLDPPLFKCNCKSRRRPCKHALALVLLFLNRPDSWVVKEESPEWLKTQIHTKEDPKVAVINQAQQEKRIVLMDQGVAELEKWLLNIVQQGLAQYTNPVDWGNMATRMVDAKLGAIARRLRYCQNLLQKEDWLSDLVKEVGSLYLFVRAWQQKTSLTNTQKKALLQVAGWNIRKESILRNPPVQDNWLVLGLTIGNEDKLTFRRTWLRGENNKRLALILDFSYGKRGFDDHWVVGAVLAGELAYYPGEAAFRAVFRSYQSSREPYDFKSGYLTLTELGNSFSETLAVSPWIANFPCLLSDVRIQYVEEKKYFSVWDTQGNGLQMIDASTSWQLLAISAGEKITVFGEYDGTIFTPITVINDGLLIELK